MTRAEKDTLEQRQTALAAITYERVVFETMLQRAEASKTCVDLTRATRAPIRFAELETAANAASPEGLATLIEEAEALAQQRAYLCPLVAIETEGRLAIDTLEEWGVPTAVIESFRATLLPKLKDTDQIAARESLLAIYRKFDAWSRYAESYSKDMSRTSLQLLIATACLLILSMGMLMLRGWVVWGLFTAGAAGACVSVKMKLPPLSVWGEYLALQPRVLARIGAGLLGSLIGCGLLAWGVVSLQVQGTTFPDLVRQCAPRCSQLTALILMAVASLLGFSERALASFEERLLTAVKK
jgi:hypothetical protein